MNPFGVANRRPGRLFVVVLLLWAGAGTAAEGQDRTAPTGGAKTIRLDEMRSLVTPFRITESPPSGGRPVRLEREPIARWNDPTRDSSDGSLWLWTRDSVPIAGVAVELYPNRPWGERWAYEFVSLSTGRFEATGGDGFNLTDADISPPVPDGSLLWAPNRPGVAFAQIPDAPAPGRTESERLRQAKLLVKRFSATETFRGQTYSLRLQPHPVHRFADEKGGIVDGAIFFWGNGTNPEVILLVEARRRSDGAAAWEYAAAPLARAALELSLDRRVVWAFPVTKIAAREDPYFLTRKPRTPDSTERNARSEAQP